MAWSSKNCIETDLKLQRKIMHPPFKGACTKRLVALAKKAAIRVFFFWFCSGLSQVCLKHNKRYGVSGMRAGFSFERCAL